jgi:hypothetical protein
MARVIRLGTQNVGGENPFFQKFLFVPNRIFREFIEQLGIVEVFNPLEKYSSLFLLLEDEIELNTLFNIQSEKGNSLSFLDFVNLSEIFLTNPNSKNFTFSFDESVTLQELINIVNQNKVYELSFNDLIALAELYNQNSNKGSNNLFLDVLNLDEEFEYQYSERSPSVDLLDEILVNDLININTKKRQSQEFFDEVLLNELFNKDISLAKQRSFLDDVTLGDLFNIVSQSTVDNLQFFDTFEIVESFIRTHLKPENFVCFYKKQRIIEDGGFIYNVGQYCQAYEALFNNIEFPINLIRKDYEESLGVQETFSQEKISVVSNNLQDNLDLLETFVKQIDKNVDYSIIDTITLSELFNSNKSTIKKIDLLENLELLEFFKLDSSNRTTTIAQQDVLHLIDLFNTNKTNVRNLNFVDAITLATIVNKINHTVNIEKEFIDELQVAELFTIAFNISNSLRAFVESLELSEATSLFLRKPENFTCFYKIQRILNDGGFVYNKGQYCQAYEALFNNTEFPINLITKDYNEPISLTEEFSQASTENYNIPIIDNVELNETFIKQVTKLTNLNFIDSISLVSVANLFSNNINTNLSFEDSLAILEDSIVREKLLTYSYNFLEQLELAEESNSSRTQRYQLFFDEGISLLTQNTIRGKTTTYILDFTESVDPLIDLISDRKSRIINLNFTETVGTGEGL